MLTFLRSYFRRLIESWRGSLSHPKELHPVISLVASLSFKKLALRFLLLLGAAAVILSALHALATANYSLDGFLRNFSQYLLVLTDVGDIPDKSENATLFLQAVWLLAGIIKLVLIVFILGVILFKFLVLSDVFIARKRASIYWNEEYKEWEIALRIYNATRIQVVDIDFEVYLRVPRIDDVSEMRSVPNTPIKIRKTKKVDRSRWPIAIPFVPYTVNIPLTDSDIRKIDGIEKLTAVQENSISLKPSPSGKTPGGYAFLVLIVRAKAPDLAGDIVETHWFDLSSEDPQFEFGKFEEVEVIPGIQPKRAGGNENEWKGWNRFEK